MITSAFVLTAVSIFVVVVWNMVQFKARPELSWKIKVIVLSLAVLIAECLIGNSGVLSRFDHFPPPVMGFLLFVVGFAFFLAFSSFGSALVKYVGLPELILFHSFRIAVEIGIYLAVQEGVAPIQMSFEGRNFDIVTGITAIAMYFYLQKKQNLKLAMAWNILGLLLLINVVGTGVLSFPTPFRVFMNEPSNIWVTEWPYIMLPGILVLAALSGHLLVLRKILTLGKGRA